VFLHKHLDDPVASIAASVAVTICTADTAMPVSTQVIRPAWHYVSHLI
jgi:hypothetical protein